MNKTQKISIVALAIFAAAMFAGISATGSGSHSASAFFFGHGGFHHFGGFHHGFGFGGFHGFGGGWGWGGGCCGGCNWW